MCVHVCMCVCVLAWPALHCKSKSSDDIINNVLETEPMVGAYVSACVSIRQEISHYINCSVS